MTAIIYGRIRNMIMFIELLDGVKTFAQQLNMTALCLQERADSPYTEGFLQCGFEPTFTDSEYKYYGSE